MEIYMLYTNELNMLAKKHAFRTSNTTYSHRYDKNPCSTGEITGAPQVLLHNDLLTEKNHQV